MKKLILISALLLFVASTNSWAYSETDLKKFLATNWCVECDLSDVILDNHDWYYANLRLANLQEANLERARFVGATLQGADLREANLQGANLLGADLREAYLTNADLAGADLRDADITTSKLSNVRIDGTKFCHTSTPWGEDNDDC